MSLKKIISIAALLFVYISLHAQNPIGLQVDSNQVVLFGSDTLCCGDRFMWLPSKKSVFIGTMAYPQDTIGEYSLSVGRSRAVGPKSIAFAESFAEGSHSMAIGNGHSIGNFSFASGFSTSFGGAATALGMSIASGFASVTGGNSSTNADLAVSFGNSRSEGNMAASFNQSRADALLCTAIGRYNVGGGSPTDYVSTDPIFEVGIGTSTMTRKNAFTIRKDGFISLGNHLGYTKLALYESGSSTYGMGVQAGQFRFNLGNPQARYAFFDQPGSAASEIFTVYGNGRVNTGGSLNVNGDISINGVLIHSSDRNRKEEIEEVNYREVLQLVNNLPVSTWQYKGQAGRHIGPMAQDFYTSFELGGDDTGIASVDADGVALAAIKALITEVEMLKEKITELENGGSKNRKNRLVKKKSE